jgi:hypothetical protein
MLFYLRVKSIDFFNGCFSNETYYLDELLLSLWETLFASLDGLF